MTYKSIKAASMGIWVSVELAMVEQSSQLTTLYFGSSTGLCLGGIQVELLKDVHYKPVLYTLP